MSKCTSAYTQESNSILNFEMQFSLSTFASQSKLNKTETTITHGRECSIFNAHPKTSINNNRGRTSKVDALIITILTSFVKGRGLSLQGTHTVDVLTIIMV